MGKLRRTMMYVPGNNPAMLTDAGIYGADSLMFDLEDSVALNQKDSARLLVYQMIKNNNYAQEVVVRINSLESDLGATDIEAMVRAGVDVIRLPKTETAEDVKKVENIIESVEKKIGIEIGHTKIMAAIEGPLGVINAYDIATASKRLIGIAIGAEDFVTSMKTKRSKSGVELLAARSQLVLAARAANIAALDTVFSNIDDSDGFKEEVKLIKSLGFDGKSVINPRQINLVHEIYKPTDAEIEDAKQIVYTIKEAEAKGSGVISLNGQMIDKPIVERAKRVLELSGLSEEVI